jgi:NAD(P)-dependent dehydrogenase (short-subunit alcohol dehydrogenase family)
MEELKDKVVLVTGAGKGAGRNIATAFAARGARLAINDLTPVNLDQTEAEIRTSCAQVKAYIVDVTKKMPIQGLVNSVIDDWGRIDILVNCAEVKPRSSLMDMDDWDWQRTLDVNLTGVFLLLQAVGRVMRTVGGGTMLTIAPRIRSNPLQAAYQVSKAGLIELTTQADREFSKNGIRVHLIDPEYKLDVVQQALNLCKKGD